jgi:hypothetical protein
VAFVKRGWVRWAGSDRGGPAEGSP